MSLPMVGSWVVTVLAVRPFTIHGDEYVELHAVRDGHVGEHLVRVPRHALKAQPTAGGRATLTFLMGQVTEVTAAT
jgi:hypothetical protein